MLGRRKEREEARESWAFLKCSVETGCGTSRRLSNMINFHIGLSGEVF